ncbi:MAG: hypothetical protein JSV62_16540 [Promethearchaeota archaeon]|nr:MAG: hypothetical protein JSV62_16540 [Candidatus Lokiarchaeota archaeon]
MEEEEENLSKEEQELFYEVLFKRIMEIMRKPEMDLDPFGDMINRLSILAGIFSFRAMVSLIPELVAFAIRYGMEVEKAYEEEQTNLEEDIQGFDENGQKKRLSRIQKDIDKLNIYL